MTVVVDRTSEEPVYEQIARQLRNLIAGGSLSPGFLLPPVRALASDLGVNLNTVARAYRLLEEEGFVQIRNRSGVEVTPPTPRPDRGIANRHLESLRAILARMRQAGILPDEMRRVVDREIERMEGSAVRPE